MLLDIIWGLASAAISLVGLLLVIYLPFILLGDR